MESRSVGLFEDGSEGALLQLVSRPVLAVLLVLLLYVLAVL
jgi:hypothetical protein